MIKIQSLRTVLMGLCAGLILAACSQPGAPVEIRPGVGADVNLDKIRPPSGVNYKFDIVSGDVPIPVSMSLTSRKRSRTKYTYGGQIIMTLPEAGNLESIAGLLSEALGKSNLRVDGNRLLVPVGLAADNRFRSTVSDVFGDVTKYTPHDCFAVIGTCRYKATDKAGITVSLLSETTEEGSIWRSKTILDPKARNPKVPNATRRSVYSIDKNAVLIDMYILGGSGRNNSGFAIRRR